jgi:hypothetical protein
MTVRTIFLLLLATAGCAGERPVPRVAPSDLPPLPRSSIVAVLAHRGELELTDAQMERLSQADAELQQRLIRLRAEAGHPSLPPGAGAGGGRGAGPGSGQGGGGGQGGGQVGGPGAGPGGGAGGGAGGAAPPASMPGMAGGVRPGPGFGMNMGPGGFQLTPGAGGMGGAAGAGPHGGGGPPGVARRDPAKDREALDARLDDADTAAFLKAEQALAPAQRERAREIATSYREQLFERREVLRGR